MPLPLRSITTVGRSTAGACSSSRSLRDYDLATDTTMGPLSNESTARFGGTNALDGAAARMRVFANFHCGVYVLVWPAAGAPLRRLAPES